MKKTLTKQEAEDRILKLREVINHHRYLYHVQDTAEISDAALDSLKHELQELEEAFPELITPDSPTQRVGGKPLEKFQKIVHREPMLSMTDVFSPEEFQKWQERLENVAGGKIEDFYVMTKIDGLAISLVYENGRLKTAATRGDGRIGEDVTQNARTIESIPLVLRSAEGVNTVGEVEVRGEVYMEKGDFERLNMEREVAGEPTFANPRNVSAGSVRQLDSAITASRPLRFRAWYLSDVGQKTQEESMRLLREFGFVVADGKKTTGFQEVKEYFGDLGNRRAELPYWIDGLVVRVNDRRVFNSLGVVGKTPRGIVAWKYPAEEATTRVLGVEWNVGRTGKLTPVARVEPTFVAGTIVQNASLHNMDEMRRLDIKIGDTVILTKAGDIIPKITKVLTEMRTGQEQEVELPNMCPVCGSSVRQLEGQVDVYCTNPNCFSMEREKILYAARAFGIDGLGPKRIERFMQAGLLSSPPDMFHLTKEAILELEGFKEKSASQIVDEIQSKKSIQLSDFIVALGIPHVGSETAFRLAQQFKTLGALKSASVEELTTVQDIGSVVAESVRLYFESPRGQEIVEAYEDAGVQIQEIATTGNRLAGKTFVLTGTLSQLTRDQAEGMIRAEGGSVSGSVSKKTSYVLVGENPGSKYEKAKDLGVEILSEEAFLRMVG